MSTNEKELTKLIYILPVLWALVLRCSIGLFPHSGKSQPHMFGDFEAQRHWMEVTVNLPAAEWYFPSADNDLNYWGLDYPPLTAYHSYLTGLITKSINSSWIDLHDSRGSEHPNLRALMRFFVLLSDIIVFLPPLSIYYIKSVPKLCNKIVDLNSLLCAYFFPGIILIDYAHFQYNVVSLGLFISASICLVRDRDIIGSILFCAAISFKQMELYHSLPVFCFLIGKCLKLPRSRFIVKFSSLAITVLLSFTIISLPFLIGARSMFESIGQIIVRLFPFSRGIYEDKVSNVWCALSVFVKLSNRNLSIAICAVSTIISSLPACVVIANNPRQKLKYLLGSFVVSLGFFLFSYHVHEKSILIPAASALLLVPFEPFWANFFLYTATLSMWPLLVKDGLVLAMIVCSGVFLLFFAPFVIAAKSIEKLCFLGFNLVYFTIIGCSMIFDPPVKLPFLYQLLISQWCCGAFIIQFLYFYKKILANRHPKI